MWSLLASSIFYPSRLKKKKKKKKKGALKKKSPSLKTMKLDHPSRTRNYYLIYFSGKKIKITPKLQLHSVSYFLEKNHMRICEDTIRKKCIHWNFLKDLLEKANKTVDDTKLAEYTDLMLKLFDSNNDGKLELTEMARLLPVQENFLLKFQGVKMCGKEFNKAFELYDQDGNGYIDENELDALLKDLCEKNKQDLDINNIPTYKKSIMALSDGGKLYRTDLALILSAGDN
ncbi:hypothetical protein FD755_016680 [Muntiacus reevesi]|uniref:Calbindin n=1 Tax=Muntiacus reevesi TaxID=9886 RepID=A0A5N3XEQ9_MUNRE|nr:hypothetical protein FD755_016680 [Muntiacus reevesi]